MTTVNYTGRDYTSRYEALLAQYRTLVPELTDLNHSNAGIVLIRLLASESDFLSYYIDWVFNSGYIETAPFKQSLINIGKALDTLPKLASASRVPIIATRIPGVEGEISIPKYTRFERLDGVAYLTDTDTIIPADEDFAIIFVTQGDLVNLTLSIDEFASFDHSKKLRYNLGANVAAYTSVVTDTLLNAEWTEVDSFYRTTANDTHYLLELYAQPYNGATDTVFLTLCKREEDLDLPTEFDVKFIRTLGANGNTGTGTIIVCPSELDSTITVTNSVAATGGGSVETVDDLRWRIPAVARTQRRAVTNLDYKALITGISGVKYCEATDRNASSTWPHLHQVLYVVAEGGGVMSVPLRQTIMNECCAWGHLGNWPGRYILLDAEQIPVSVSARIGVESGYEANAVFTAIRTALQEHYNISNTDFFKQWNFSELHHVISSVQGVSWVEFNSPVATVNADIGEILILGTVTLTQGS